MSLRILVADDEKLSAQLLAENLEDEGFSDVAVVHTAQEAVDHVEKNKPDLVYLDVSFNTEMTGMDVLQRIRQTTPESRVCMMTGFRDDCRSQACSLGVISFICKPAMMDEYVDVARSLARGRDSDQKGI